MWVKEGTDNYYMLKMASVLSDYGSYVSLPSFLRWPNTVFLYLCVIRRYFQTTGSWAAKIGKIQVQLKEIIF